jgi:hypothetical protein
MKNGYLLIALSFFGFACAAQPANEDQASAQRSPELQQMQGRMEDMRELMARIHSTKDPQERQRLMHEHMQSMQQAMTMMGDMMRGQRDVPGQAPCAEGDTSCQMQRIQGQQQMMNQRMTMMQMMMEQMMGQMTQRDAEEPAAQPDKENHEAHH